LDRLKQGSQNETKLQAAPQGTKNVDAISRKGERYSIKTGTWKTIEYPFKKE